MKLLLLLLISCNLSGQIFVGGDIYSKGVGIKAGYLYNNLQGEVRLVKPLMSNTNNRIVSFSLGYQLNLKQFNLTPSLGVGFTKRIDFTKYNADQTGRTGFDTIKVTKLIPATEIGYLIPKYNNHIKISFSFLYTPEIIYSLGFKVIF